MISLHDTVLFKKRTKRLTLFVLNMFVVLFYSNAMLCDKSIEKQ